MEHPLRVARRRADLTLDRLSELTGISKATLSRVETGHQKPSFDIMRTLITFFADREPTLSADDFVNFKQARKRSVEGAIA